jgi:ribosomal protein S8
MRFNKKSLKLLLILKKLGVINACIIVSGKNKYLKISPFIFKKTSFFKHIKLVSTPSKTFTIKIKALRIINMSIKQTILLLETSQGIMTHKEALKYNISGKILCVIS